MRVDVEQVLDEAVHPGRRAFDRLAGFLRPPLGLRPVSRSNSSLHEDRRERIPQIVGDDAEHVVPGLDGALRGAIEPGVLDRERRPLQRAPAPGGDLAARRAGTASTDRKAMAPRSLPCARSGTSHDGLRIDRAKRLRGARRSEQSRDILERSAAR